MKSFPTNGTKTNRKRLQAATLEQRNGSSRPPVNNRNQADQPVLMDEPFDQPVILQQTALWSRSIIWGIVGVTVFSIVWAALAKVEEAVPAAGKLEPQGRVQDVQVPVNGVVEEILVRDGDWVEQGTVLMRLDPTATQAQLDALTEVRTSLEQENLFYRAQISGLAADAASVASLNLPPEMLALTANRAALQAENQLYRTQLGSALPGASLTSDQFARLQAQQTEAQSRIAAAQLQISQLEEQVSQNQIQLDAARANLEINQSILNDLQELYEEGGISRLQYTTQRQKVLGDQAEVATLQQRDDELSYAIAQAGEQLQSTTSNTETDLRTRMADNDKRLAEIDGQINKAIVENEKRLSELTSQISQVEQQLRYEEVRAPISGYIFDMQAQNQGVVGTTAEPVLKIVPDETLIAQVYITNKDIGFVSQGMPVDVRIDSFPFSEYGDIEGEVIWIGSDALPPDQIRQTYTFPAKIEIDQQELVVRGREIPLQSGMSVSVNIKTRKRSVLSIFTDLFRRKVESVTTSR